MTSAIRSVWTNPYVRVAALLVAVWILFTFFERTRPVWVSFLVAYTLAYLFHPLLVRLERWRVPRWTGVSLTVLVLIGTIAGVFFLLGQLLTEMADFTPESSSMVEFVRDLPDTVADAVPLRFQFTVRRTLIGLRGVLEPLGQSLDSWMQNQNESGALVQSVASILGGSLQLVVIIVLTAYLLSQYRSLLKSFLRTLPARHRPILTEAATKLDLVVGGYLRGQILIALFVGLAIGGGLFLLGVPYAGALAVLAGVFNIVPLMGPIIAGIPALLLAFGQGWATGLATLVLFLAVNMIDGNLITPLVHARTTKVHPITVILSVALGLALFGLWGALLAVPAAALVKLLYREYYLESDWYLGPEQAAGEARSAPAPEPPPIAGSGLRGDQPELALPESEPGSP